jgi:DNA-binding MarR family transcriptional regulator
LPGPVAVKGRILALVDAAEVWKGLYDFCQAQYRRHLAAAAELGMTPGDVKALLWLVPGQAQPMRALAEQWETDASTLTWLIDRLEERGLVQRGPHPTDRRVRVVLLTKQGEKIRAGLLTEMYRPPAAFDALSPTELRALSSLVPKLTS